MQTQNPFLDEFSKLTTAALGLAQAAGEEAKTAFRAQAEKLVADFDLVRRDELDALKAQGVGPKRAEILLKRLNAGREFQVIPGGGETTETLRAVLRLVAPAGAIVGNCRDCDGRGGSYWLGKWTPCGTCGGSGAGK